MSSLRLLYPNHAQRSNDRMPLYLDPIPWFESVAFEFKREFPPIPATARLDPCRVKISPAHFAAPLILSAIISANRLFSSFKAFLHRAKT